MYTLSLSEISPLGDWSQGLPACKALYDAVLLPPCPVTPPQNPVWGWGHKKEAIYIK